MRFFLFVFSSCERLWFSVRLRALVLHFFPRCFVRFVAFGRLNIYSNSLIFINSFICIATLNIYRFSFVCAQQIYAYKSESRPRWKRNSYGFESGVINHARDFCTFEFIFNISHVYDDGIQHRQQPSKTNKNLWASKYHICTKNGNKMWNNERFFPRLKIKCAKEAQNRWKKRYYENFTPTKIK